MNNTKPRYGYIGFFKGQRVEVYADSLALAFEAVREHFKPSKKDRRLISVELAEKDGEPVIHHADT